MFKNKKQEEPQIQQPVIVLGIVLDGEVVEQFAVDSPRLASLFLNNPTFVDLGVKK